MPILNFHRKKTTIECVGEKLELIETIIKRGESLEGKLSHSSTDSSHQKSGETGEFESFENVEEAAKSPNARTPAIDPKKFENLELELEQNVRGSTQSSAKEQLVLFLAVTLHIRELSTFITMFFRNGGLPFLIVYAIELIIFGIPYALMELSIGQYASLPAVVLFARIAPILSGVGVMLLVCRILRSLFVCLEPRYVTYLYNSVMGLIIGSQDWLRCDGYPNWACRNPYGLNCSAGEVALGEKCVLPFNQGHTHKVWSRKSAVMFFKYTDDTVQFTPAQLYYLFLENYTSSLLMGVFVILVLTGLISWRGTKFLTKLSYILTIFPLFSMACMLFYTFPQTKFSDMVPHITPKWEKLFALQTWIDATQAVSKTMCVADGTMLTLGSLSSFNNNVFRDVSLVAGFGFLIRCFFILCMLPLVALTFNSLGMSIADLCTATPDLFWPNLVFWKFADISKSSTHNAVALIFYAGMIVSMIGYQVITFEICLGAIYQRFPHILYLPENTVRYCLLSVLVGFFTLLLGGIMAFSGMHFVEKIQNLIYLETIVGLTLYQLLAVAYFYGAKRILVNMKTMCSKHMSVKWTKYGNLAAQFFWAILLPLVILTVWLNCGPITTYRTMSFVSIYYSFLGFIPIHIGLYKVVSYILRKKPLHTLFQTHRNWGPINMHYRRSADHDERAARILI